MLLILHKYLSKSKSKFMAHLKKTNGHIIISSSPYYYLTKKLYQEHRIHNLYHLSPSIQYHICCDTIIVYGLYFAGLLAGCRGHCHRPLPPAIATGHCHRPLPLALRTRSVSEYKASLPQILSISMMVCFE